MDNEIEQFIRRKGATHITEIAQELKLDQEQVETTVAMLWMKKRLARPWTTPHLYHVWWRHVDTAKQKRVGAYRDKSRDDFPEMWPTRKKSHKKKEYLVRLFRGKARNQRVIIEALKEEAPLSVSQIAKQSGASYPGINNAMRQLAAADIVFFSSRRSGGRRPKLWYLEGDFEDTVEIDWSKVDAPSEEEGKGRIRRSKGLRKVHARDDAHEGSN